MRVGKITADGIRAMKARGEKIAALTTYDYAMTRILDELEVPLLLVGDSLGMVVLGYANTTFVTMEEMVHHVRAAGRAKPQGLLVADLPMSSYATPEMAVLNARRLVEAGAEAVKAEGGVAILPQVQAIVAEGIPFLGHLGMLPQHVVEEGGYRVKGKQEAEKMALFEDAQALQKTGAFAIVLELVTVPVAKELSQTLSIPTIGIGSGLDCDGQILVTTDLWATSPGFIPKHIKPSTVIPEEQRRAVQAWKKSIGAP